MASNFITSDPDASGRRTVAFMEANPAQRLLQELRRNALIPTEDWVRLAPERRERLSRSDDVPTLLDRLVHEGLLTEYQAHRIARGEMYGLILGNYRLLDKLGAG